MGHFISMSGVVGSDQQTVFEALQSYADQNGGTIRQAELSIEDDRCLAIATGIHGVTVMYPAEFSEWDHASSFLSQHLKTPVFSFHVHDSDLWMFTLYENGDAVDQFNPIPEYWGELDEDEQRLWRGNADIVVARVRNVKPEQIEKYLVPWDDDVLNGSERKKAYPTDQFNYGDDWQLVDFMGTLGFDYPIDDRGDLFGTTYRFECNFEDAS